MGAYARLARQAAARHWRRWLAVSGGFTALYYVGLLALTILRFRELPNYCQVYDVVRSYRMILRGTPAWGDAWRIILDEPLFETGFKDPHYYGVATWSYLLIPPKMAIVFLSGALLATVVVLTARGRELACPGSRGVVYAGAGAGSLFVGLTSATLTWVACCATPSWVVALTMLGMSSSLALWLEPIGAVLTVAGFALFGATILAQLRRLRGGRASGERRTPATPYQLLQSRGASR